MGDTTKIQWTTHTFNPWRGCSKIAPGCANCYAAREAKRFPLNRGVWGDAGTRVVAAPSMWKKPMAWNRRYQAATRYFSEPHDIERPRVFCASLADVFEAWGDGVVHDHTGRIILESYLGDARMEFDGTEKEWKACIEIERGTDPQLSTAFKIAAFFDCNISALWSVKS